jgi:HAD superfamily hydrolase (TIGR01484 family)
MDYRALACDYDGTVAQDGRVDEPTMGALERVRKSGRKLVLITGRELDDLLHVFTDVALFDRVVAENGAVLYDPQTRAETALGTRPPSTFVQVLERRGVQPLSVGRVIVATWEPHQATVLNTIREFGLDLQVICNKGAVMVLPCGIDKATGLLAALKGLDVSPIEVVGVGDAENDQSFLANCGLSVAVANALPVVKMSASLVTQQARGAGVRELIDQLLAGEIHRGEG